MPVTDRRAGRGGGGGRMTASPTHSSAPAGSQDTPELLQKVLAEVSQVSFDSFPCKGCYWLPGSVCFKKQRRGFVNSDEGPSLSKGVYPTGPWKGPELGSRKPDFSLPLCSSSRFIIRLFSMHWLSLLLRSTLGTMPHPHPSLPCPLPAVSLRD